MISIVRPVCPHPQALGAGNYKHPTNKEALRQASSDKCMYCESKISHIDFAHVEHIKPKAGGRFPELEFVWENLGYACPKCNNSKGDEYDENTPYLDPYSEDPQEHLFGSGAFLFPRNGSERGQMTIGDIDLNRNDLLEKRQARITEFITAMNACYRTANHRLRDIALAALRREASADREYSMIVGTVLDSAMQ